MKTTGGNILLFKDPENSGWIQGWGVFRMAPWHLAGIFATQDEAEAFQETLQGGYQVGYGSHERGTDNFITGKV